MGMTAASALSVPGNKISYNDLPAEYRTLFQKEMASAKANARSRAPSQSRLIAETKGGFNGYTGSKSDNSLKVSYTVSDSVVEVGEEVVFQFTLECTYQPMIFTVGGVVFNENFDDIGTIGPKEGVSYEVNEAAITADVPWTPTAAGYFNFVLVVRDGNGNQVAVTTNTVQVYSGDQPTFDNVGFDQELEGEGEDATVVNQLAMALSLNRSTVKVGQEITATVTLATAVDPVSYTAAWTHTDADGNTVKLTEYPVSGEVNAQAEEKTLTFSYKPLEAGEIQFVINATNGDGYHISNNSPLLTVEDGYYLEARLNRISGISAGETVTATYSIYGHECDSASYFIGWECLGEDDEVLASKSSQVDDRTGKSTYTPRIGSVCEFYVGVQCEHIKNTLPATASVPLVDGLMVDLDLTASSVKYGSSIGVNYSVEGGLTPYEKIIVTGYSYDKSQDATYSFVTKTLTDASGTVTGKPTVGDQVYFVVKVVESDGNTSTWTSDKATFTGGLEVTTPEITVTGLASQVSLGDPVTLTYTLSGGSGTIEADSSTVKWLSLTGDVLSEAPVSLSGVNTGTASYTPEAAGTCFCQLELTDAYGQSVTWKSDPISVVLTLPGDADGSGVVDSYDVLRIMQYDAGWSVTVNDLNADVDGSGSVTLSDAVQILRYLAGEIASLK